MKEESTHERNHEATFARSRTENHSKHDPPRIQWLAAPKRYVFFTSPTAPKSRCPNRRTKSKSHAAVLSPSHLKCGGLFLLILLNFTVNVESMLAAFLWVKKLLALYIAKLERFLQVIPLY